MHAANAHRSVHGQLGGDLLGVVQIRSEEMTQTMTADPERILLAHGGGGQLMSQLIREHILPKFSNETLSELTDAARLTLPSGEICFTTDSYVVKPLFFRGGDIGKLAVCGTVNDLAVSGAKPLFLSLALIIEEGFELALLERILQSISEAAPAQWREHRDRRHQNGRAGLGRWHLHQHRGHRRPAAERGARARARSRSGTRSSSAARSAITA